MKQLIKLHLMLGLVMLSLVVTGLHPARVWAQQPPDPITIERAATPATLKPGEDGTVTVTLTVTGDSKVCPTVVEGRPADIVLVIDHSSSMTDPVAALFGTADRLTAAKEAAKDFVANVDLTVNRIAVVQFDDAADVVTSFSTNGRTLNTAIDSIQIGSGTAIDAGILMATQELRLNQATGSNGVIILMSDGGSDPFSAEQAAEVARQAGQRLIAIGFGEGADEVLLKSVASADEDYFFAPDGAQLKSIYATIAQTIRQAGAASNLQIVHTFDSTNFEVVPNSISAGGTLAMNTITWNLAEVPNGTTVFTYQAHQRLISGEIKPGTFNVDQGDAVSYLACQATDQPRTLNLPLGLPVEVLAPPTPTPTPTSTPTPTPTFTPIPTSTPSPQEILQQQVYGVVCGVPWWLWCCLGLLLLLSLVPLFRRCQKEQRKPAEKRCWCDLLPWLLLPLLVLLLGFILNALLPAFCATREAVYFWRIGQNDTGIYLTSPDGYLSARAFDQVNRAGECVGCHTVSSSSRRIAAIAGGGVGQVVVFDLNGKPVSIPSITASYLSWAPDGRRLAFSTDTGDIAILDLETNTISPLAGANDPSAIEMMPTWGPNSVIAFVRSNSTSVVFLSEQPTDIYTVPETGGTAQPLLGASGSGYNYYPAYSPDGRWLAFTHHISGSTTYADPAAEIFLVSAGGGEAIRLEANDATNGALLQNVSNSWPSWSEDGHRLAFNSKRQDKNFDIFITEIFDNGHSGPAVPLASAATAGVFEHLPFWGRPPALDIWALLLPLWPCLIPFLLLLLAWWLCKKFLCKGPKVIEWGRDPTRQPPAPLPLLVLEAPRQVMPALIIGVGGTGRWVLTHLKKVLLEAGLGELPPKVRFVLIDTAQTDNVYRDAQDQSTVSFAGVSLDRSDMLLLEEDLTTLVQQLVTNPKTDSQLADWFPAQTYKSLGNQLHLAQGTHGRRPMARAGLVQSLRRELKAGETAGAERLWQLLTNASQDVLDNGQLHVVLVGSTAGGLSGILSDLAYLTRVAAGTTAGKVRVEGYFTTAAAFDRVGGNTMSGGVNTWATLREFSRAQLSNAWPHPFRYGLSQHPPEGESRWPALDDVYLFGGMGQPETTAGKADAPWATVFAAMADIIAFRLDRGVANGWRQWRAQAESDRMMRMSADKEFVVSTAGSFTYRIPLPDMLEAVKLRWLVTWLNEALGLEASQPTAAQRSGLEPAQRFLSGEMKCGEPPHGLLEIARLANGETLDATDRAKLNLPGGVKFEAYFCHALRLLLMGKAGEKFSPERRLGRVNYVLSFLAEIQNLLTKAERAEPQLQSMLAAWRLIVQRAAETLQQQQEILTAQPAGIYARLRQREQATHHYRAQMELVAVRHYLWTRAKDPSLPVNAPGNALDLVEEWHKQYAQAEFEQHWDRLFWEVGADGTVCLKLITFEAAGLTVQPENKAELEKALLKLADYIVRDVWQNLQLAEVLRDHGLSVNREQAAATLKRMWPVATPYLEGDADPNYQRPLAATGLTAATKQVQPALAEVLRDPTAHLDSGLAPSSGMVLEHTDKYGLTLVRTFDLVRSAHVPELAQARKIYLKGLGRSAADLEPTEYTAVFAAEANALQYERRLQDIGLPLTTFDPYLVVALENLAAARAYALAWATGWVTLSPNNKVASLCLPGQPAQPLHQPNEGEGLPPEVVGLLKFTQAEATTLQALQTALAQVNDEAGLQRWRDYYGEWSEGLPTRFAPPGPIQNFAAFAALCVYDHLAALPE